jgi:hypothetical protein
MVLVRIVGLGDWRLVNRALPFSGGEKTCSKFYGSEENIYIYVHNHLLRKTISEK